MLVLSENQRHGGELLVFHMKANCGDKDCTCECGGHVCMYVCYSLEKWFIPQLEQERITQAWSILHWETQHSKNDGDMGKDTDSQLEGRLLTKLRNN